MQKMMHCLEDITKKSVRAACLSLQQAEVKMYNLSFYAQGYHAVWNAEYILKEYKVMSQGFL